MFTVRIQLYILQANHFPGNKTHVIGMPYQNHCFKEEIKNAQSRKMGNYQEYQDIPKKILLRESQEKYSFRTKN